MQQWVKKVEGSEYFLEQIFQPLLIWPTPYTGHNFVVKLLATLFNLWMFFFYLFKVCLFITTDSVWEQIDINTVAGVTFLQSLSYFVIITEPTCIIVTSIFLITIMLKAPWLNSLATDLKRRNLKQTLCSPPIIPAFVPSQFPCHSPPAERGGIQGEYWKIVCFKHYRPDLSLKIWNFFLYFFPFTPI